MATKNQVYKHTITNGGGTVNLPVSDSTTNIYEISGTATLAGSWTYQPSGSPTEGTEFYIRWQAAVTIGANNVTIFGTALTAEQALQDLEIICYYNGSAWDVDILSDGPVNDSITNAKLAPMPTMTIKGNNTGGTLNPLDLTVSEVQAMLGNQLWKNAGLGGVPDASTNAISNIPGEAVLNENELANQRTLFWGSGNKARSDGFSIFFGENLNSLTGNTSGFITGEDSTMGLGSFVCALQVDDSSINGSYAMGQGYGVRTARCQFSRNTANTSTGALSTGSQGVSQQSFVSGYGSTTDATPGVMSMGDGVTDQFTYLSLTDDTLINFRGTVSAMQVGGGAGNYGDCATWTFRGVAKCISGVASIVGTTIIYTNTSGVEGTASVQFKADAGASAWTLAIAADNATYSVPVLKFTITGEANKTIAWNLELTLGEIHFEV